MVKKSIKKKILFILPNLNFGGAEKVTVNLFDNLSNQKFEKELFIQEKRGPLIKRINNKKKIKFFGYHRFLNFSFELIKEINRGRYHYVFSSLSHISFFLLLMNIFGIIKIKLIVRESNFIKKTINNSKIRFFLMLYYKFFYKKIDIIIASSRTILLDIHKFTKIKKNRIFILYNPVEEIFFRKKFIKNFRNKRKILKFLSIGRLTYQKNFSKLIKILNNYRKYSWKLKIFGNGKQKKYLNNLINNLKLNSKIKLCNETNNIHEQISSSDFYFISSKWEGMPNAVIENIIMRKKIIFLNKIEVYYELKSFFPDQVDYFYDKKFKFQNLYKKIKIKKNENHKLFSEKLVQNKFERILK